MPGILSSTNGNFNDYYYHCDVWIPNINAVGMDISVEEDILTKPTF